MERPRQSSSLWRAPATPSAAHLHHGRWHSPGRLLPILFGRRGTAEAKLGIQVLHLLVHLLEALFLRVLERRRHALRQGGARLERLERGDLGSQRRLLARHLDRDEPVLRFALEHRLGEVGLELVRLLGDLLRLLELVHDARHVGQRAAARLLAAAEEVQWRRHRRPRRTERRRRDAAERERLCDGAARRDDGEEPAGHAAVTTSTTQWLHHRRDRAFNH
mmetsp:Transcript_12303/g.49566  ORF Transcript_12303/g.49566 Transcript_12303/m.49566 type:complete len:220 (-) Transcript_12303:7-666(-)